MITNKDIRVENGFLIINGDKYPLDGQSPETIMQIVEDNSDTTPTENSDAPITSGGVYTADKAISDTIGDITQTGVTGDTVADQIEELNDDIVDKTTISDKHTITTTLSGANLRRGEYYTYGNMVFVSIDVEITSSGVLTNLPNPIAQVNVTNCDYPNNAGGAYVEITTDGKCNVVKPSSAASVRCIASFGYLSNNI